MKILVLVINASVHESVVDLLRALDVTGFTVSHVEGHGPHTGDDQSLTARDRVVGFVPRVRVDMVLTSGKLAAVLDALKDSGTSFAGHGTFWVAPVEHFGRF